MKRDYRRALKIAFELGYPHHSLLILQQVLADNPNDPLKYNKDGEVLVNELVQELAADQTSCGKLLSYARDWNTNARNAYVAHLVLRAILTLHTPEYLFKNIVGMKEIIVALLPYTTRHIQRIENLQQQAHLLDYTLSTQGILAEQAHVDEGAKRLRLT
jgi:U3 small nucleolar RNA-associated protein 13